MLGELRVRRPPRQRRARDRARASAARRAGPPRAESRSACRGRRRAPARRGRARARRAGRRAGAGTPCRCRRPSTAGRREPRSRRIRWLDAMFGTPSWNSSQPRPSGRPNPSNEATGTSGRPISSISFQTSTAARLTAAAVAPVSWSATSASPAARSPSTHGIAGNASPRRRQVGEELGTRAARERRVVPGRVEQRPAVADERREPVERLVASRRRRRPAGRAARAPRRRAAPRASGAPPRSRRAPRRGAAPGATSSSSSRQHGGGRSPRRKKIPSWIRSAARRSRPARGDRAHVAARIRAAAPARPLETRVRARRDPARSCAGARAAAPAPRSARRAGSATRSRHRRGR